MQAGRNNTCHCGSGKKFRNCCGREASERTPAASSKGNLQSLVRLPDGTTAPVPKAIQIAVQCHQAGRLSQAAAIYELVLQAAPGNSDALHLKGLISHQMGNHKAAVVLLEQAIKANPDIAMYHNNLAKIYMALHRHREAATACNVALALQPGLPESLYLMGNALLADNEPEDAALFITRLLNNNPDFFNAYTTLVEIFCRLDRSEAALNICQRALATYPENPTLICAAGIALAKLNRTEDLIDHYQRALEQNPDFAQAENNLANALASQGRPAEALLHYQKALTLAPNYADTNSSLLMTLNYLTNQDANSIYLEHLKYAQRFELPLLSSAAPHKNNPSPRRRLKIGYVSSDFRQHAVAHFIEPVLRNHDRAEFEIFCYSNSLREDGITHQLQTYTDTWRNIMRLSDAKAAELIRDDEIDILIDLNGHTSGNRLLVFARKPAPIQITWIGYPNTTGLSSIDYRITDEFADPTGITDLLYSEQLIRLPNSFSCYQPPKDCPDVAQLPAHRNGFLTFGSYNNLTKITPGVISVWARILKAIPDSRLIIKTDALSEAIRRQSLQTSFLSHAELTGRLILLGRSPSSREHFEHYSNIDIALDPFPYNGTTTTCDALWMGVPVITLMGNSHVSRVGFSQLSNLALPQFIADTSDEYISIAVRWSNDLLSLERLREELRTRMKNSPLMDAARLTRNLEDVFMEKWRAWCAEHHS